MPSGYHTDENGQLVSNLGSKGPIPKTPKYARDPDLDPFEPDFEMENVEALAKLNCTDVEIAHRLNFNSKDWIKVKEAYPEIEHVMAKGQSDLKVAVRIAGVKKVQEGDITMIKLFHNSLLGYRESLVSLNLTQNNLHLEVSKEEMDERWKYAAQLAQYVYRQDSRKDSQSDEPTKLELQPEPSPRIVDVDFNANDAQAQAD